jgi:hypothetical protein
MTPDQIKNWREVLARSLGVFVLFLSDDDIEVLKNRVQLGVDIENRKAERKAKREKSTRKGLCSHGVAAKHCQACK